jgi:cytoskeletal protein RodZ
MAIDQTLTLGQYLRRERERKGLTIEQVASATKIGIRTLHALESDHYSELPAKPFIRGFVISYARFIGLDHKETLTHFNQFLDERVHQERPNREGGHSGYAFEKREGDPSRTILGIAMGGFVVIGAIAMLVLKPSLKHHHGSHLDKLRALHDSETVTASSSPEASTSLALPLPMTSSVSSMVSPAPALTAPVAVIATPSPVATSTPEPKQTAATLATPQANPSPSPGPSATDPLNSGVGLKASEISQRVVCKALNSVWVRYRVDDKPTMQFILKKDKILVLRGRQSVILQVGEPEHLNLSINRGAYHSMDSDPNIATLQDDATLFFPAQLSKTIQEPFKGEKPLSARKSPALAPSETPSPEPQ